MLCTNCNQFLNLTFERNRSPSPDYFQEEEEEEPKGCYICTEPSWKAVAGLYISLRPRQEQHYSLNFTANANGVGARVGQRLRDDNEGFTVSIVKDAEPLRKYTPPETLDLETFQPFAQRWLSCCLSTHSRCNSLNASRSQLPMPTRLVRIGTPTHDQIQVVTRSHFDSTPGSIPYVTLSHCWGSIPFFTLTSTSHHELLSGVQISRLSKTFQDALAVTRALGYQFMWIDSLCIIQDSKDDWNHEAPLMQSVYRGAVFNIAATASANGDGGLFRTRELQSLEPTLISYIWDDGSNQFYQIIPTKLWRNYFEGQPLSERGWVVQELLLAPRVLHFNKNQMFWECYDAASCETCPEGIPDFIKVGNVRRNLILACLGFPSNVNDDPLASTKQQALRLWAKVVEHYTKCKLSYLGDKLVAVAGIARLVQKAIGDEYCAGLWVETLPTQLLWLSSKVKRDERLKPRSQLYRAPSWSWASVDTGVMFGLHKKKADPEFIKILVNIISHEVVTATQDPFSKVIDGTLRLSGHLFTKVLSPSMMERIYWDVWLRFDYQPPSLELHFLPILVLDYTSNWTVSCLLLVPTGKTKGQFRRCGVMMAQKSAFGMSDWTEFQSVNSHEWLECEAMESPGVYRISIV